MSTFKEGKPLVSVGSLSAHTRPVEALAAHTGPDGTVVLCTGDTMGIIKVWTLRLEDGPSPRWRGEPKGEDLKYHRTKICELVYGSGQLWSGQYGFTLTRAGHSPRCTFQHLRTRPFKSATTRLLILKVASGLCHQLLTPPPFEPSSPSSPHLSQSRISSPHLEMSFGRTTSPHPMSPSFWEKWMHIGTISSRFASGCASRRWWDNRGSSKLSRGLSVRV